MTFYRTRSHTRVDGQQIEVPYGTLDLMVLKTLDTLGPLHGYGIARRIEQVAEGSLALNQGTIYPALLRLEQKGWIASEWGASENNRKARFYSITRAGRKQLTAEAENWGRTVAMMARLLETRTVTRAARAALPPSGPRHATPAALDEEIAAHLALLAADYERRGLSPADARAAARREFGPVTQLRETYREQRRLPFFDTLAQDLAYALRQLRHNPASPPPPSSRSRSASAPTPPSTRCSTPSSSARCPSRTPTQLVQVQLLDNNDPVHVSYPLYRELAARQQALDGMFAVSEFPLREAVLRGRGPLRAVRGSLVTGNYFQALGVDARLGRTFTADDDRPAAPPVAVISDEFWEREFARSPAALGQSLELNHASATIIGVAPPEFFGETVGNAPDVWLPIIVQPQVMPSDWLNAPSSSWLAVLARLHPGVSPRQAEQVLEAVYRPLAGLSPRAEGHQYRVRI